MMSGIRYVLRIDSSSGLTAGNELKLDVFISTLWSQHEKINKTPLAAAMGAAFCLLLLQLRLMPKLILSV
jgi:hypothetical protein